MRILVVEDEPNINRLIVNQLKTENYSVDSCMDGEEAAEYIKSLDYDAIVLDLMLPEKDGLTVLKEMRADGMKTPVLILTAKGLVEDRVKGLNLGADDYLAKPFSLDELTARLRAIIRRNFNDSSDILKVEDLTMNVQTYQVVRGGKEIMLSSKEFGVLEYLLRNKNMVLSRQQIQEHVWSYDYDGGSNVVDVYVRFLRKKIEEGFSSKLIQTVRGVGYIIRGEDE